MEETLVAARAARCCTEAQVADLRASVRAAAEDRPGI
jgi:hypothetical protein